MMESKNQAVGKITGEHFYKFFQCPHWLWYDVYGEAKKRKEIPPIVEMVQRGKVKDEKRALGNFPFEEISPEAYKDLDEAFLATVELMRQGKNIYRGVLLHENWAGTPDLLEARSVAELGTGVRSRFGDYYYVAYDISNNPFISYGQKFQLVFYSVILNEIQGIQPRQAFTINVDGETQSFFVDDYVDQLHIAKDDIVDILEGKKLAPFLKSGCKSSPWFALCEDEAQSCNDVSLIYRLSQMEQRLFYDIGIRTIEDLAKSNIEEVYRELPNLNFDRLAHHHLQAQALAKNESIVLRQSEFPKVRQEIYFDIESDPTEGIDYLFGIYINEVKTGSGEYKYFFADGKEDEKRAWQEFVDFVDKLEDFVIYHYALYEQLVFTKLARRYGTPWRVVRKFKDNAIDLLRSTTEAVVLPLYFYSLKDVGRYIGHEWTAKDAGGAESVVWYNDWQASKSKKIFDKIIQYNKDDVLATKVLKEWLELQKPRESHEQLPD